MPNPIVRRRLFAANNAGAQPAAWTPALLAKLAFWYKSDAGVISSVTKVSQWQDQSGLGRHLIQNTDSAKPTLTPNQINGYPSLIFDGVEDYMKTAGFTLNQPTTIFIVLAQLAGWADGRRIFDGNVTNSGTLFQWSSAPHVIQYAGNFGSLEIPAALNTYCLITSIYNGANSIIQTNNNLQQVSDAGSNNMGGFTLSNGGSLNGAYANIGVAEIFATSDAASTEDRDNAKLYIANRYAIPMP